MATGHTHTSIISAPVHLQGVTKKFGELTVVDRLDLTAQEGKLTTLLGPSGCGKTTTLRMVAGFYIPDEGEVFVGSTRITDAPPHRRPTRTVFQNYALFPHMTVEKNVAFGLDIEGVSRREKAQRVDEVLEIVGLGGLGKRQPGQLSGGQQQRVALARALVTRPKVLLLDEPLSNLDAKLRITMRTEIRRLQTTLGITTIYVTHDQEEALSMSDEIAVMNEGKILQLGSPSEIYERPVDRFVAQFLGLSNFIVGEVVTGDADKCVVRLNEYTVEVAAQTQYKAGERVSVTVRPENLTLNDAEGIPGRIISTMYLGAVARYHIKLDHQDEEIIADEHAPVGSAVYQSGDAVMVGLRAGRGFVQ
ncbi:MAG: ABC transporter ATP-binding protein [Anaerolineaceae bacterium]|nr:MAG: ABC transporter ATP-binding protein [Anaerolineaceae bacterium]